MQGESSLSFRTLSGVGFTWGGSGRLGFRRGSKMGRFLGLLWAILVDFAQNDARGGRGVAVVAVVLGAELDGHVQALTDGDARLLFFLRVRRRRRRGLAAGELRLEVRGDPTQRSSLAVLLLQGANQVDLGLVGGLVRDVEFRARRHELVLLRRLDLADFFLEEREFETGFGVRSATDALQVARGEARRFGVLERPGVAVVVLVVIVSTAERRQFQRVPVDLRRQRSFRRRRDSTFLRLFLGGQLLPVRRRRERVQAGPFPGLRVVLGAERDRPRPPQALEDVAEVEGPRAVLDEVFHELFLLESVEAGVLLVLEGVE
mmetsp:Transcript_1345/g.3903  ORF Transcript_1345/g.3903 Transcript_1345/m.3903 type:complete len:318 (-) Transcript_1345:1047-2000(-)